MTDPHGDTPGVLKAGGVEIPVHRVHTLVIGSGAASLKAADRLHQLGISDMAVVTESVTGGTSYNTGSDKQTYYRLSTGTKEPDSPYAMAEDLFKGGAMHGDHALIEAIGSTEAFHYLASIGVPFPTNQYGAFIGYKTDHDSRERGSSIGPYTSKKMVEALRDSVAGRNIPLFDRHAVVSLVCGDQRVLGALAIDMRRLQDDGYGLTLFMAENVVFGTGGPGGIYEDSVYPAGHTGSIGLALEIGAEAVNLQESQFGLASITFRWNVSGSYQQVLPAYISTDQDGGDECEFLKPFFPDSSSLYRAMFLKGYQWPFDAEKIISFGSSLIDILVYRERVIRGRKVFLDFRKNPTPVEPSASFSLSVLPAEAYEYLRKSDALQQLPIDRLLTMNPQAVELYRAHGIDLERDPLEIAVCAQHNNGGLAVDQWWESVNVKRLFPVGEVAGTHGVSRPGGSALNSGQVGAARAAQKISGVYHEYELTWDMVREHAGKQALQILAAVNRALIPTDDAQISRFDLNEYRSTYRRRMSTCASMIRSAAQAVQGEAEARKQAEEFSSIAIDNRYLIPKLLQTRHLVLTHRVYLSGVLAYLTFGGGSRGSCLVLDEQGKTLHPELEETWRYKPDTEELREYLVTTRLDGDAVNHTLMIRKPIPMEEFWFERVWREYREKTYLHEQLNTQENQSSLGT